MTHCNSPTRFNQKWNNTKLFSIISIIFVEIMPYITINVWVCVVQCSNIHIQTTDNRMLTPTKVINRICLYSRMPNFGWWFHYGTVTNGFDFSCVYFPFRFKIYSLWMCWLLAAQHSLAVLNRVHSCFASQYHTVTTTTTIGISPMKS